MTFTVSLGWWLLPLAITIVSTAWAALTPAQPMSGLFPLPDPTPILRMGVAVIASLSAWLVWALLA